RLRQIEEGTRRHEEALAQRRTELAKTTPPAELDEAWQAEARAWDFGDVNRLIEQHNRWYPVEAQLPMDPRTGDYALVDGRPYLRLPLDAAWALERLRSL